MLYAKFGAKHTKYDLLYVRKSQKKLKKQTKFEILYARECQNSLKNP